MFKWTNHVKPRQFLPQPHSFSIKTPGFQASWSNPLSPVWDTFRPGAPPLKYLVLLHQGDVFYLWFLGARRIGSWVGGFPTRFLHLGVPPRSAWHPGTPKDPLEVRLFVWVLLFCLLSKCLSVALLNLCLSFSVLRLWVWAPFIVSQVLWITGFKGTTWKNQHQQFCMYVECSEAICHAIYDALG